MAQKQEWTMRKLGFVSMIFLGVAFSTNASEYVPKVDCTDSTGRYITRDFILTEKKLGTLTFIDAFQREVVKLYCGVHSPSLSLEGRIEVACTSSHFGDERIVRLRVHQMRNSDLTKLAVLEVQESNQDNSSIDSMIPLSCEGE